MLIASLVALAAGVGLFITGVVLDQRSFVVGAIMASAVSLILVLDQVYLGMPESEGAEPEESAREAVPLEEDGEEVWPDDGGGGNDD